MIKEITSNLIIDKKGWKAQKYIEYFYLYLSNDFLIDIAEEAAVSEIFNIFLGLSFFFIYYEVTGYLFYHISYVI